MKNQNILIDKVIYYVEYKYSKNNHWVRQSIGWLSLKDAKDHLQDGDNHIYFKGVYALRIVKTINREQIMGKELINDGLKKD